GQVRVDRGHPLIVQSIDPLGAPRLLDHQPGVLEQTKVTGDCRPADRQRVGDAAHRPTTAPEQLHDGPPMRVAERVERVAGWFGAHVELSTLRLSPSANRVNDGARSGIDLVMRPASGPVYTSRIAKRTFPSDCSVRVYARVPVNRPSGIPPRQTMRWPGVNSTTVTGNPRLGFTSGKTVTLWPNAIVPSTRTTAESQSVHRGPSTRTAQTASGLASMTDDAWNSTAPPHR